MPGPWELSEGNTSLWAKSPWNARIRIANVIKHASMNGIDHDANARLIAAAPDMLEALESAINCLYAVRDHERENYGPLMGKVENALINKLIPVIKAARGEK